MVNKHIWVARNLEITLRYQAHDAKKNQRFSLLLLGSSWLFPRSVLMIRLIQFQYPLCSYMLSSFYDEWMYHLYHCILFCVFFQSDIVPPQEQWLSAIDMRVHANGSLITETDIGQTAFDAQCPGHKMTLSMGTFNAVPILYAKTTKPSLWNPDFVVGSLSVNDSHMDVSENRGYPQIIHFNRVFHYKPSILGYLFLETSI